jgi:hypothetical protein
MKDLVQSWGKTIAFLCEGEEHIKLTYLMTFFLRKKEDVINNLKN